MEALDYWRLCDELNIIQAALLIVGCDPGTMEPVVEDWEPQNRPEGFEAAKYAVSGALRRSEITGRLVPLYRQGWNNDWEEIEGSVDPKHSTIQVSSLKIWLGRRGFTSGFFFPDFAAAPDYLDPFHPRYAPKLAAAIKAWLALEDESMSGRSPKQALVKWLRQHAAALGLSDDDGKPNETGIDETAKIANWQPGGGAPKTPDS